jgi:hypothetical protein
LVRVLVAVLVALGAAFTTTLVGVLTEARITGLLNTNPKITNKIIKYFTSLTLLS